MNTETKPWDAKVAFKRILLLDGFDLPLLKFPFILLASAQTRAFGFEAPGATYTEAGANYIVKSRISADFPLFQAEVDGRTVTAVTSTSIKQIHLSTETASWMRNTTFFLFSDHGGLVKGSAQELLNAGVPRQNIFCVGVIYYPTTQGSRSRRRRICAALQSRSRRRPLHDTFVEQRRHRVPRSSLSPADTALHAILGPTLNPTVPGLCV